MEPLSAPVLSSASVPTTGAGPRVGPHQSPFYKRYLLKQGLSILGETGDKEAVRAFYELEKTTPLTRLPKQTREGPAAPELSMGIRMAVIQGATLGVGDEAVAGLLAATTGLTYDEAVSDYRAELEMFRQQHPKAALGAEVAGGLLTAGLGAGAVNAGTRGAVSLDVGGATFGQRVAAAAAQGTAAGAVAGAGNAEGGLGPRMLGALGGGVLGGALGTVLTAVGIGAGSLGKTVTRAGTRGFTRIQHTLGVSPQRAAREELYRALRNDGLLTKDGALNIELLQERIQTLSAQGTQPTILEAGGEATLDLAEQASKNLSPDVQRVLESFQRRQLGQDDRLMRALWGELTQNTKLGIDNAYDAITHFTELGLRLSKPWYAKAHTQIAPVSPRIRALFEEHQVLRDAWNAGAAVARSEDVQGISAGLRVPTLKEPGESVRDVITAQMQGRFPESEIRKTLSQLPDDGFPTELPIKGIDYMQRGLRLVYDRLDKIGKGLAPPQKRVVQAALDEMLAHADRASPAFQNARGLYSTHKGFARSIELGQQALHKPPGAIRTEIMRLPVRDRDAYRLGYVEALRESRSMNPDAAAELFGVKLFGGGGTVRSRRAEQLRAIFADAPDAAEDFMARVAGEARVSYTMPKLGGRFPTSQEAEQAVEGSLPGVRASPDVAIVAAGQRSAVRASKNFQQQVNHELVRLMGTGLRGGPDEVVALVSALRDTETRLQARTRLGSRTALLAGHAAGRAIGTVLSP